jgi:methionine sulfoxide reductase heme-binding subunit
MANPVSDNLPADVLVAPTAAKKPSKKPSTAAGQKLTWLGPAIVVGCLIPILGMIWDGYHDLLGANPVQRVLLQTGRLALILLLASLACTPAKIVLGWTWPLRIRKALGLLAFGYAFIHMLTYVVVDHGAKLQVILEDVLKRPFITVGMLSVLIMLPLAITSTKGMVKRLGFVKWQRLHRLVYWAAGFAALHFFLQVKKDVREPLVFAAILAVFFAVRGFAAWRKSKAAKEKALEKSAEKPARAAPILKE